MTKCESKVRVFSRTIQEQVDGFVFVAWWTDRY